MTRRERREQPQPAQHRIDRSNAPSLKTWSADREETLQEKGPTVVDCGWGRLLFGYTFSSNEELVDVMLDERKGRRDIAFYLGDPHVVVSLAPQDLFIDPSNTYRMYLEQYRPPPTKSTAYEVRRLLTRSDANAMNRIYARRHMVGVDPGFVWEQRMSRVLTYFVAEDVKSGEVIGTVTGVDHVEAFDDPEGGCSLWALAVDPQTQHPGIGQALVAHLLEHYIARGRAFLDLSVMHDNTQAIALYEKLGFQRVPVFCVKRKNPINEPLFIAPSVAPELNPYADIIVREARRRGIGVHVLDEEFGYLELTFGGRSILTRESLSELTNAVAMSRCDEKRVTHRVLSSAGLSVPAQADAADPGTNRRFLDRHGSLVVKPARGEQGAGISVDVTTEEDLEHAIAVARVHCSDVILEEYVEGEDLRVVVIDFDVVAAAVRRPPAVTGTGQHTVRELIEKQSRRRAAATGGESAIPIDDETRRVVGTAGYDLDSVLPPGETILVRKTANLHSGGTIHDVTDQLHPSITAAAVNAARALNIPVVGLDFIVKSPDASRYVIIEANERPGLANHEPQPTAERFIDMLFPQTASLKPST